MLARTLIKVGGNSGEAYWCCMPLYETVFQCLGARVSLCVLQSICFVCVCVCHAFAGWECDARYLQFKNLPAQWWHSSWASGMLAKRGHIGLGSDPVLLALKISSPVPTPGHGAVSCFISCPVLWSWTSRSFNGIIMNSGSHCCEKFWPSVFIIITNSIKNKS